MAKRKRQKQKRTGSQGPGGTADKRAAGALREAVRRVALAHWFYGYRPVQLEVQQEGYAVGSKVIRRMLGEDNLLAIRRR